MDPRTSGIIAGSVIGAVVFIICCCVCCSICTKTRYKLWKGWSFYSNTSYVKTGMAMHNDLAQSIFQSGNFESFYHQYNKYHGPFQMKLGFHPQAGYVVHGGGKDDVGTYVITGMYSPRTLRMGLDKHYQPGTGDPNENLGHVVKIQVEWSFVNQQFEGKYYLRTNKHRDENLFIIRFAAT